MAAASGFNRRLVGIGTVPAPAPNEVPNGELPPAAREVSSPVWSVQDPADANNKLKMFVMYHSTKSIEAVQSIIENGFRPSVNGLLGPGVYVSRDYRKAFRYGRFTFKLLVYPGKVANILDGRDHLISTWQKQGYDTAWVPPNMPWIPSGLEENCIADPYKSVKILGLCQGFDKLPDQVKAMVSGVDKQQTPLSPPEVLVLKEYLFELHLTDRTLDTRIQDLILSIEDTNSRLKDSPEVSILSALQVLDLAAEELRCSVARAVDNPMMEALLEQGEAAHSEVLKTEWRIIDKREKEQKRKEREAKVAAEKKRLEVEAAAATEKKRLEEEAAERKRFEEEAAEKKRLEEENAEKMRLEDEAKAAEKKQKDEERKTLVAEAQSAYSALLAKRAHLPRPAHSGDGNASLAKRARDSIAVAHSRMERDVDGAATVADIARELKATVAAKMAETMGASDNGDLDVSVTVVEEKVLRRSRRKRPWAEVIADDEEDEEQEVKQEVSFIDLCDSSTVSTEAEDENDNEAKSMKLE